MMRELTLKNNRLQKLLSNTIEDFYSDETSRLMKGLRPLTDKLIPDLYPCSDEYLQEAFKHKVTEYAFPRASLGLSRSDLEYKNFNLYEKIGKNLDKVGNYLGTPYNALGMCYPDKGYIGWHHNGNAYGYNILLTYSQDGDGHFSYWDYDTKSIIRLQDKPGWNVRVGYYVNEIEHPDKVFWHMAETKKQRITIAWILNHKEMWINLIDEITEGDYDKSVLDIWK